MQLCIYCCAAISILLYIFIIGSDDNQEKTLSYMEENTPH